MTLLVMSHVIPLQHGFVMFDFNMYFLYSLAPVKQLIQLSYLPEHVDILFHVGV